MKKFLLFLILFLLAITLLGCSAQEEEFVQMGNPWIDYDSLKEAEKAAGFSLGLPENIADIYTAEEFRVMNGELLEVIYYDDIREDITVRKAKGEDRDISGVYLEFDAVTENELNGINVTYLRSGDICLMLFSRDGYSYSIYARDGYKGISPDGFFLAALS